MIRITELADGRERFVGGLGVEASGLRVLVDPGGSSGLGDGLPPALAAAERLDAIVLTHAHADHTGRLPAVVAAFPDATIVATPGTVALLQAQGRWAHAALDHVRVTPFYERCVLDPIRNGRPWTLRLLPAGHLLGAAMAVFETLEGCVVCSGDVSLASQYTVRRAARPRQRADALVLESTYGDREFRPRAFAAGHRLQRGRRELGHQ